MAETRGEKGAKRHAVFGEIQGEDGVEDDGAVPAVGHVFVEGSKCASGDVVALAGPGESWTHEQPRRRAPEALARSGQDSGRDGGYRNVVILNPTKETRREMNDHARAAA